MPELLWLRCLDATGRGSDVLLELREDAEDKPENWKRILWWGDHGRGDHDDFSGEGD